MYAGDRAAPLDTGPHAYVWPPAGAYVYMNDLLQLDACRPMVPTHLPLGAVVHSPLPWRESDRSLATHQLIWSSSAHH